MVDAAGTGLAVDLDIDTAVVDDTIAGLAVADNRGNAEPGEDRNPVAEIDGEGALVGDELVTDMVVVLVIGAVDETI